jgi:hypothetical protein
MKRLSIKVTDRLDARLTTEARRRKTAKAALVRAALERELAAARVVKRGSPLYLVRDLIGCVAGPGDLSVNKRYMKDFGR